MINGRGSKKYRIKYWLVLGLLFYLGTAISSIIRSLDGYGFGDNLYMSMDWLSACIIYFFIGGVLGHLIDKGIAKYNGNKIETPIWVWVTLGIWIVGSVLAFFMSKTGEVGTILIIIFPLAYGIFFAGAGYVTLLPGVIEKIFYGKFVYDILLLSIFISWLYIEINEKKTLAKKILLGIILITFLIGCVWTALFLIS